MIRLFADAYGNARLRAHKSRLRGPEDFRLLVAARSVAALAAALGADPAPDAGRVPALLFEKLLADYARTLADYPRGEALFRALLRLHEVENLKLAWRARASAEPPRGWALLWKPLGRLETLRLSDWRDTASLRGAALAARGTAYARIVEETLGAHESDLAAAQFAFDRWARTSLADEARRLPRAESAAADLALAFVRELDYDELRRGVTSYGLTPDAASAATVLLRTEERPETLRALAAWTAEAGPLCSHLPARLSRRLPPVTDWDGLAAALARDRRERCRHAFAGYPFRLAPPLAYLMLREAEVRGLSALVRSRAQPGPASALSRSLAASALES